MEKVKGFFDSWPAFLMVKKKKKKKLVPCSRSLKSPILPNTGAHTLSVHSIRGLGPLPATSPGKCSSPPTKVAQTHPGPSRTVPPPLKRRSSGTFAEEAASLWTSSSGLLFFLLRFLYILKEESLKAKMWDLVREERGTSNVQVRPRERAS